MERDAKGREDGAASQRLIWLTALIYPHAYHDGMEMTVWIKRIWLTRDTHAFPRPFLLPRLRLDLISRRELPA